MINLYEGNGYTKYVLRSGTEITLHEGDFKEMLGFKDEMVKVKVRCNKLEKEIHKLVDENIELEKEIKKLMGVLIWIS